MDLIKPSTKPHKIARYAFKESSNSIIYEKIKTKRKI